MFWKVVLYKVLKWGSLIAKVSRICFSNFVVNLSQSIVISTIVIISDFLNACSHFAVYVGLNMRNWFTKVWNNATEVEDYELAQEHGLSIITVHFKDHSYAGFLITRL